MTEIKDNGKQKLCSKNIGTVNGFPVIITNAFGRDDLTLTKKKKYNFKLLKTY